MNADKVIVQSEFVKKIYESYGYPEEKLIALGSPKMDAVIRAQGRPAAMPEARMEASENCVIDRSGDYRTAFACSDAMITTYSSIINEYMATGKPIMIFQTKPTNEAGERSPMDLRVCYFRFEKGGGMPFEDFLSMVRRGEDPKREERMQMLHERAFANLDGTAGEKIYACLKEKLIDL